MTEIKYNRTDEHLIFDVVNHAENSRACLCVSSVCNVFVMYMDMIGIDPEHYEPGRVKYDVRGFLTEGTQNMADAVHNTLIAASELFPEHIKIIAT